MSRNNVPLLKGILFYVGIRLERFDRIDSLMR